MKARATGRVATATRAQVLTGKTSSDHVARRKRAHAAHVMANWFRACVLFQDQARRPVDFAEEPRVMSGICETDLDATYTGEKADEMQRPPVLWNELQPGGLSGELGRE